MVQAPPTTASLFWFYYSAGVLLPDFEFQDTTPFKMAAGAMQVTGQGADIDMAASIYGFSWLIVSFYHYYFDSLDFQIQATLIFKFK